MTDPGPDRQPVSMDEALDRLATAAARAATDRVEARVPVVVDLLRSQGVDVLVLKGPVTRHRLYAPDERRPVADIDVLVDPGAFGRAGRVLRRAGYRRYDRHGHSDAYTRGDDADVDLHLTLPYIRRSPRRTWALFTTHRTTLELGDVAVPVLDEPAHVVHLAIHAAVNRFDDTQRSFTEWERGAASLDEAQRTVAVDLAGALGVDQVWDLAVRALAVGADRAALAAAVPVWEAEPRLGSVRGFLASGTPAWVKWRDFQRLVALQLSDGAVNEWRAKRDAPPLRSGTVRILVEKGVRLVVVTVAGAGRLLGFGHGRGSGPAPDRGLTGGTPN